MAPAERRRLLLATAARMLEQGGTEALRMDALARECGVTRPVVYQHFGDREGLLVALIEQHGTAMQARVDEATADDADLEGALRQSVRAYLVDARKQGAAIRGLMAAEGISPAVERARRAIWDGAARRWAERFRGAYPLSKADAEALAGYHLHGLWSLAGGPLPARRVEELLVATVLASLEAVAHGPNRKP